jgi:hypothetical protein
MEEDFPPPPPTAVRTIPLVPHYSNRWLVQFHTQDDCDTSAPDWLAAAEKSMKSLSRAKIKQQKRRKKIDGVDITAIGKTTTKSLFYFRVISCFFGCLAVDGHHHLFEYGKLNGPD